MISNFFLRIVVCTLLLALFWGSVVYFYQTDLLREELSRQGRKASTLTWEDLRDPFESSLSNPDRLKEMIVESNRRARDFKVIMFKLRDREKKTVFYYAEPSYAVFMDRYGKSKISEWLMEKNKYALIEYQNRICFRMSGPIHHAQNLLGYLDVAAEVNRAMVDRFREMRWMALIIILGTILTMTLVLYPLIFYSYRKLRQSGMQLLRSHLLVMRALGNAAAQRDSETDDHNYRVTYYSLRLAEHLKLENGMTRALFKGAFLHDLGKIGISDRILLKPGKLDKTEWAAMQSHVERGVKIIENIPWLEDCREIILYHHEKYDGSGYPAGLAGDAIPLPARIFSIADVFDALTSARPYKPAFSYEQAIAVMNRESQAFDPYIFQRFLEISESAYREATGMGKPELETLLKNRLSFYFGLSS